MSREDIAGDGFQIVVAALLIVRCSDGGPEAREKLGNQNLFKDGLDARPGERRGKLRLSGRLRQLPEQSAPAIQTVLGGGAILLAGLVRNAARAADDRPREKGEKSGELGQTAAVHGNDSSS